MRIVCAVCDDEQIIRTHITEMLCKEFGLLGHNPAIYCYVSPEDLINDIKKVNFNVLFMDIEFANGKKKLKIMERIMSMSEDKEPLLVYVSSHDELVFESLKYRPFRFIRKSRLEKELPEVVGDICRILPSKMDEKLMIENNGKIIPIRIQDILYIESFRKEQIIYKMDQTYSVFMKMKEIEEMLQEKGFIRFHRSYLVNLSFVKEMGTEYALMTNGVEIPISKYRKKEIRECYKNYIINQV